MIREANVINNALARGESVVHDIQFSDIQAKDIQAKLVSNTTRDVCCMIEFG